MAKIVLNRCYGGFSLSEEAVKLGRVISGNPLWGNCPITGEMFDDGSGPALECYGHVDVKRTDPVLVQVVEQLGKAANGDNAKLVVTSVEGKYRVCEYDGREWIETPDTIKWEEAKG